MYDTDKIESGLIEEYERLFAPLKMAGLLKNEPIKYLEVGIYKGGSMLWAKDYFNHYSTIIGIDKNLIEGLPETLTFYAYEADQNDSKMLAEIADWHGQDENDKKAFDLIIDDGCHFAKETENTFNALWPFVAPGGIYIIEDWSAFFDHKDKEQYAGMPELISKLMTNKTYHGIKAMRIINKENGMSYAAFWKR